MDDCIFHLYPRFHAQQYSRSGNTMAIHPVFESGLLCSGRVRYWLFQLVNISFDHIIHLLLLEQ